MFRYVLLVFLLIFAAGAVQAETCTTDGDGTWTAITTGTVSWAGCTASSDDDFIISSGFTVTVTTGSTITQDGTTASTGVTVASGGTFVMDPGSAISLNVDGLDCAAGSVCTFLGDFREFGVVSPGTDATPSAATRWYAGDVWPCTVAGSDCTLATLNYDVATYERTVSPDQTFIEASIDAIAATDVLYWWSLTPTSNRAPSDEGFFYEIASAETADPYTINFEVQQKTRAQHGFPMARRNILKTTLSAAANPGDRTFSIQAGNFPSNDYYNGRMLRFEDGSGNPEFASYRIMDSVENGASADTIKIADANGIVAAKASGDDVWIDYGWAQGDSFLVIRPVRISSATAAEEDSDILLGGTITIRGTVFDQVGRVDMLAAAAISEFSYVWFKDVTDSATTQLNVATTTAVTVDHFSMTGGSTVSGDDVMHGIYPNVLGGPLTLNMVASRHMGDDYVTIDLTRSAAINGERFRCQYRSTNGASQGCLQAPGSQAYGAFPSAFTNVEVLDALNGNASVANAYMTTNLTVIASTGAVNQPGAGIFAAPVTNVYFVGNNLDTTTSAMFPTNGSNFVARDNLNALTNGTMFSALPNANTKNGLVIGNTFYSIGVSGIDGVMENIAFIDNTATLTTTSRLFYKGDEDVASYKNILIVDNTASIRYGIWFQNFSDASHLTVDKIAVYGLKFATAIGFQDSSTDSVAQDIATNTCLFGNVTNEVGAGLPDPLIGVPPNFVDPDRNRYDIKPGTPWYEIGCGVKPSVPVGVCKMNRTLAWSNLTPECMGDPKSGAGGGSGTYLDPAGSGRSTFSAGG